MCPASETAPDAQPVYAVIGGTGGIGAETSRRLVATGAHVCVAARDEGKLSALAQEIGADTQVLDASNAEQVQDFLTQAIETHGRLDGVANCVGSMLLKPAHLTTPEEWDETVRANLGTAFAVVRAAGKTMRRTGGSVVLVSSAAALTGLPNHEAIAAAKGGIIGLTLSAAATYAPNGIRFNAVAPGLVRTPLSEAVTSNEKAEQASIAMHPLRRLGEPGDIASAIVWLLSPEQSWVTGQVIGVDGGLSSVRARVG